MDEYLSYLATQIGNRQIFLLNFADDFRTFDALFSALRAAWARLGSERDSSGGSHVGLLPLEMVSIVVLAYRKKCPCHVLDRVNSCSRFCLISGCTSFCSRAPPTPAAAVAVLGGSSGRIAVGRSMLSLPIILSDAKAFEINDIQAYATSAPQPLDPIVTMLHWVRIALDGVFSRHRRISETRTQRYSRRRSYPLHRRGKAGNS